MVAAVMEIKQLTKHNFSELGLGVVPHTVDAARPLLQAYQPSPDQC